MVRGSWLAIDDWKWVSLSCARGEALGRRRARRSPLLAGHRFGSPTTDDWRFVNDPPKKKPRRCAQAFPPNQTCYWVPVVPVVPVASLPPDAAATAIIAIVARTATVPAVKPPAAAPVAPPAPAPSAAATCVLPACAPPDLGACWARLNAGSVMAADNANATNFVNRGIVFLPMMPCAELHYVACGRSTSHNPQAGFYTSTIWRRENTLFEMPVLQAEALVTLESCCRLSGQ